MGVENFCNQITFYYSSLSKEAATQFTEAFTAEDKIYVSDLIKCVLYFLKTECNYDEYTFLSFIKILKTFLVEYVDDYIPTIDDSTFWHMYKINNVDTSEICPLEIIRSFENLYKDYNFEYTKRLVDGLYSCIRFFLFENELDYVHNEIIFSATLKLINEIDERLALIFENITPRKDNFDLYE